MKRGLGGLLLAAGLAAPAAAQGDCYPDDTSNEAKTFAIKSVPLAFSGMDAPTRDVRGSHAGVELAWLPRVSDETATPTVCRPGKGPENANALSVLFRPRARIALPGSFGLDVAWVPPIPLEGFRANLLGAALVRPFPLGRSMTVSLRGHATVGTIKGPITCPDEALEDPTSECFEGQESDDSWKPNIFGADATLGLGAERATVRAYIGGGYTHLAPRFQVNFTNVVGSLDNRRVIVDLDRLALFGGVAWNASSALRITGEVYSTPADAVTGRVLGEWRLGPERSTPD